MFISLASEMKHFGGSDTEALSQHFEKRILKLEEEKKTVQILDLKKKQDCQLQLLKQKKRSDEAAKQLQDEIKTIKVQKVQLQHKIKQEAEQFRQWKASHEKELLQLRKEGRRNQYEQHKLQALNQHQKMESKAKDDHFCLLEDNVTGLVGVINLSPVIDQNLFYTGMKYTTATFATAMCNIVPAMFFLMAWILS
ncbi:Kinesin-like protein KIN-4A [Camellia lanceoleosa]|uniref:Kinesin-like protein KIN-4A n=1 Tax=Camellia lanceoleosa TaxID=1840588 RepID=A0ACC0GDK8_9ERIC|nr:Kinesin-like protein KIN-4A [Camellia lanceoleosa]